MHSHKKCLKCEDEIQVDEFGFDVGICESCTQEDQKREANARLLKHKQATTERIASVIPKRFIGLDTDKTELLHRSFNENLSVYLTGPTGSGKTTFACSLAKKKILHRQQVGYVSFPKFLFQVQNSYGDPQANAWNITTKLLSGIDCLVIDDLGTEKQTDFSRQMSYLLINECEQNLIHVIITSNLSLSELETVIDPRVASRIAGMCQIFKFNAEDRRLNQ